MFQFKPSHEEMNKYLSYLINWKGLNTKLIENCHKPQTFKQYFLRARNWRNGCRPREYSNGLFPDMIINAEKYTKYLLRDINDKDVRKTMTHIFMYSFLLKLLTTKVKVMKYERKVNLVSDNSMTIHRSNTNTNTLRKLLQKYAFDHQYIDNFPSHRQEAIGYFTKANETAINKISCLFQRYHYFRQINDIKREMSSMEISEMTLNLMQFIIDEKNNINKLVDTDRVIIDKEIWKKITANINRVKMDIIENEIIIEHFESRLNDLIKIQNKNENTICQDNIETDVEMKCGYVTNPILNQMHKNNNRASSISTYNHSDRHFDTELCCFTDVIYEHEQENDESEHYGNTPNYPAYNMHLHVTSENMILDLPTSIPSFMIVDSDESDPNPNTFENSQSITYYF